MSVGLAGACQQRMREALPELPQTPAISSETGFPPVLPFKLTTYQFSDGQIEGLLSSLDVLLAKQPDPAKWMEDAGTHFWRLQNRLERAQLSPAQEARLASYFDALAAEHPADKAAIEHRKWMATKLAIGRVAPDITGLDFDGVEFSLRDYRGKVTVVIFTGEWCGPCRSEYPYQRLMLEVHKAKPFALLGVNSDKKLDIAQKSKVDNRLDYRAWWDGHREEGTDGPIAEAWGVTGWPTTYVLDAKGVIRFAGTRHADTLKAVAELLDEAR